MTELNKKNIGMIIFVDIISIIIAAFNLKWIETRDYTIFNTLIRVASIAVFMFLGKLIESIGLDTTIMLCVCFMIVCIMCIGDLFRIVALIFYPIEFLADTLFSWL